VFKSKILFRAKGNCTASLGLRLRQHCKVRTFSILLKKVWKDININREDFHQCGFKKRSLQTSTGHDPFCSSVDHDIEKPNCSNLYFNRVAHEHIWHVHKNVCRHWCPLFCTSTATTRKRRQISLALHENPYSAACVIINVQRHWYGWKCSWAAGYKSIHASPEWPMGRISGERAI
jgi:hypothetical protein